MDVIEICDKSASDTISLTTIHLYDIPKTPDGGYGFVIVFAAFCNNVIADGLTFSFGIIFYELIENYNESYFKTSLFTCLFNGIPLLFAPITSLLTEKYSCRTVAIVGGYITHLGFFLSFFTETFGTLFLTLSIIAPIGLSFVYIPSIVMVSTYFDKKRAFATGVAVSGSGVGAIVFAPLIELLCRNYTLKGALLILSGIILNACVFGLLFRPLYNNKIDKHKAVLFQNVYDEFVARVGILYKNSETYSQLSEFDCTGIETMKNIESALIDKPPQYEITELHIRNKEFEQPNTNFNGLKETSDISMSTINIDVVRENESFSQRNSTSFPFTNSSSSHNFAKQSVFLKGINPYIIPDHRAIFGRRSFGKDMHITIETVCDPAVNDIPHHKVVTKSKFHSKYILNLLKTRKTENIFKTLWLFLSGIFDAKLLFSWKFFGMMFSNFILYGCYPNAYNNLPSYSHENYVGNSSIYPLLLGIGNCAGQISLGFLADLSYIQSIALYSFALILSGISCTILPIYKTSRNAYVIFSLFFGFVISANFSLCSVVLVDIFGLEQLTSTYGMVLFGQGLGSLLGPGISGILRDSTGSYDEGFLFSGLGIIFSSVLLFPLMIRQNNYIKFVLKNKKKNFRN